MITKFKIYEQVNQGEPRVGDYVICEECGGFTGNFTSKNIGQIDTFDRMTSEYKIKYENIPPDLFELFPDNLRFMFKEEIKYWSKNKEDLIPFINADKFNL